MDSELNKMVYDYMRFVGRMNQRLPITDAQLVEYSEVLNDLVSFLEYEFRLTSSNTRTPRESFYIALTILTTFRNRMISACGTVPYSDELRFDLSYRNLLSLRINTVQTRLAQILL